MDRPWVVTVGVGSSRATTWLTTVGNGVDLLTLLMHKVPTSVRVGYWQTHMVTPASHSIGVGRPIKLEGGKSLVEILSHLRGAAFDIWGGGGRKKKFAENVIRKKSLLSKLMKNMLTRKAYDKNIYFSSATKIKKKLSDVHHKKKSFLVEVKKKLQPTKTLAAPHISNGASLTPKRLNYVTVLSVKAVLPWKLQLRFEIQVQCRLLNILYNIVI